MNDSPKDELFQNINFLQEINGQRGHMRVERARQVHVPTLNPRIGRRQDIRIDERQPRQRNNNTPNRSTEELRYRYTTILYLLDPSDHHGQLITSMASRDRLHVLQRRLEAVRRQRRHRFVVQ